VHIGYGPPDIAASVSLSVDGVILRNTIYPETDIGEARAAAARLAELRG
jgi:hypothetical protein